MTARGRSLFFPAAIIAATAAIIASFITVRERGQHEEPLPRLGGVPAFIVYDQTGAPFPSSRLDGSVWLADFFFTRCQPFFAPPIQLAVAGTGGELASQDEGLR